MLVAPEDAITLNVGGQRFGTSRATLRSGAPAFFDALQDRARLDAGTNRDSSQPDAGRGRGEYLIDRDPQHFPAVLNFLRSGRCALPDTTAALLALREEGEAYQVHGLVESIDTSPSMRVHQRLANAAHSKELLQVAADAVLEYAFGSDHSTEAWPGMMAEAVSVDVQVALAATKPVQGRYRCRLWCAIAGPAAVKQLQHEYQAAGEAVESPLATSNLRSPFYNDLSTEQQAVWDEIRFLRKNADAIAYLARQGSCFRVGLQLITPDALAAASPATAPAAEKQEWRPVYDTTLRFEVRLV